MSQEQDLITNNDSYSSNNTQTVVTAPEGQQKNPVATTSSIQEYLKSVDSDYFQEIKDNAKLKVFTVIFEGGEKKVYARRKVTMKEVAEIERRREVLRLGQGSALDKANALLDFYWYSAQCHLRETKSTKPMNKSDYERVTFEDFRKIIDACEFIMLYGVPKN